MATYRNELMPDDGMNLPVVPFRFENQKSFTDFKKQCETELAAFYAGRAQLPVPEAIALSVLRANVQKRYDHQLELEQLLDHDGYVQMMLDGLWETRSMVVKPGMSIKAPLDHFIVNSEINSVETGFRISVGQPLSLFNNTQTHLNALLLTELYGYNNIHFDPENSIKVTRVVEDRPSATKYVVIKSKTRGVVVSSTHTHEETGETAAGTEPIESIGRRTGIVPFSALGVSGLRAAKVLARYGNNDILADDHREEMKTILTEDIATDPQKYLPVVDRFYFARVDDDR